MRRIRSAAVTVSISISSLREISKNRPPGYFDDVTQRGIVSDGALVLDEGSYRALCDKYRAPARAGPGFRQLSSNLSRAAFRVAKTTLKGGKIKASKSEIARRLSICGTCDFFQKSPMKCRKCGCFLNIKSRLETEHCPILKW